MSKDKIGDHPVEECGTCANEPLDVINSFTGKYAFLSNFSQSYGAYPTVEHRYQAAKTLDAIEADSIMMCPTPGGAKRLGRSVTMRPDWDDIKLDVMYQLVLQKFGHDRVLKIKLLATGNAELVEGNYWHDNYWGECRCLKCKENITPQNHLGRILMRVRRELMVQ